MQKQQSSQRSLEFKDTSAVADNEEAGLSDGAVVGADIFGAAVVGVVSFENSEFVVSECIKTDVGTAELGTVIDDCAVVPINFPLMLRFAVASSSSFDVSTSSRSIIKEVLSISDDDFVLVLSCTDSIGLNGRRLDNAVGLYSSAVVSTCQTFSWRFRSGRGGERGDLTPGLGMVDVFDDSFIDMSFEINEWFVVLTC